MRGAVMGTPISVHSSLSAGRVVLAATGAPCSLGAELGVAKDEDDEDDADLRL